MYLTRRFVFRAEYKTHVVFTSRDDNEEVQRMESRVLVLFLGLTLVVGTLTGCGRDRSVRADDYGQPPVIEPDVERREIEPPKIDTEDFEVGIFAGPGQRRGFRRQHRRPERGSPTT